MSQRSDTMYVSDTLIVEQCFKCQVLFAMPQDLQTHCKNDHTRSFYCPNGHGQVYAGPTPLQRERKTREQLEQRLASEQENVRAAQAYAELERRSAAAFKGHITRLKNRVGKGKCPACSEEFPNIAEHMAHEHPGYGDG